MATRAKSAATQKKPGASPARGDGFAEYLLTRAPAEDVAAYDADVLDKAAALARKAVMRAPQGRKRRRRRQRSGDRPQRPADDGHHRRQRQHAVPVRFGARRDHRDGRRTRAGHPSGHRGQRTTGRRRAKSSARRSRAIPAPTGSASSTCMCRCSAASEAEGACRGGWTRCSARCARRSRDWKPMLARLDQAISEFRYAPIPLDKAAVTEAIAFLEWLRDDNFTFLGMREFHYSGGEKSGTLERADEPGSASSPIPDVRVLRRDARRRHDDAGNPRLPARPRSADRHQGQRQVGRPPPHLSRLHRRQDLRRRAARCRASCASSACSPRPPTRAR